MNRHVHIICPEVPWPADHSKAIDSFCQIKELFEKGIKIHLHYFCSDLHCHPTELNRYCESVSKYEKNEDQPLPFSASESKTDLVSTLNKDDYPVIMEGVLCCGMLNKLVNSGKKILVRIYDDECRNCEQAAKYASPFLKKMRLNKLSREFKQMESLLPVGPFYLFAVKENAESFYADRQDYKVKWFPLMYPFSEVSSQTGSGNFCLYHGDLSDNCNEKAAEWLLSSIFNDMKIPLVIAGRKPSRKIQKLAHFYTHSCFIADPSQTEMEDLISKAHIHVLPSFSYKRPEFKLVHALYAGRHCLVNENAVAGARLEEACYVATSANAFKSMIMQLIHRPFEEPEIRIRENIFNSLKVNKPADELLNLLFG